MARQNRAKRPTGDAAWRRRTDLPRVDTSPARERAASRASSLLGRNFPRLTALTPDGELVTALEYARSSRHACDPYSGRTW